MSIQNRRPLTEDSPAHDDFWSPDALKVVNTRSLQMRQTFEKVKVHISEKIPLKMSFDMEESGHINFFLAPRLDDY